MNTGMADDIEYNIKSFKDSKGGYPYFEQINQMIMGKTSFIMQHHDLRDDLAIEALTKPEQFLEAARTAVLAILSDIHPDYEQEIRDSLRFEIHGINVTPMKQALSEHIDKLLAVEGKVIAMSEPEPYLVKAVWRCVNCNTVEETKGVKPKKCEACSEKELVLDNETSIYIDMQAVKLQEATRSQKSKDATISCVIKSKDHLWYANPGQTIKATGILRAEPFRDSRLNRMRFLKRLEVVSLEKDQHQEISLTPDDIKRMKYLPDELQFYEKLRDSIAPHLYGIEEVKESCMLALASQGLERPLNVGLFGDPDTGKSEAMFYAVDISHNGHRTDMGRSTSVGLTVESAYDEDTKTRLATPGLLNFADQGVAGIDELQAINSEDAKKLNGVLEAKEIVSDKAGVHVKLPARCAVIITSNSEYGRWDTTKNIYDNLKFLGSSRAALISRFDLIHILKDTKDAANDSKKADKILSVYGKTEMPIDLFREDTAEYYGFNTLRQYFYYIAKYIQLPDLPESLTEEFKAIYLKARADDDSDMVGNRYLKSIIRLARIIARLLQRDSVTMDDLTRAKALIDSSRSAAAFDPYLQRKDANLINGGKSTATLKKEDQFWECFNGVDYITTDDLVVALELKEWKAHEVRNFLAKASKSGLVYEKHGQEKWSKKA